MNPVTEVYIVVNGLTTFVVLLMIFRTLTEIRTILQKLLEKISSDEEQSPSEKKSTKE
jgi:hypothetical protein